jgi:hypothetical protein
MHQETNDSMIFIDLTSPKPYASKFGTTDPYSSPSNIRKNFNCELSTNNSMVKLAIKNSTPPSLALALVNLLSGTSDKSARTVQSGATAVEQSQLNLSRGNGEEHAIVHVTSRSIIFATNCKLSTAGA